VNRSRAAGVIVALAPTLDATLKEILVPLAGVKLNAWFKGKLNDLKDNPTNFVVGHGSYEEQKRHWWSNESPVFVAEQCCESVPTTVEGRAFDGTMRIGFALSRKTRQNSNQNSPQKAWEEFMPGSSEGLESAAADDLEVEWLGGYWKLPKSEMLQESRPGDRDALREAVVSAARISGTAPVPLHQLYEVYTALDDAVPQLFGAAEPSVKDLDARYREQPELAAYVIARMGTSAMGQGRMAQANSMLDHAQKRMERCQDGPGKQSVHSFLERARGVIAAKQGPSNIGQPPKEFIENARRLLPTSSNALWMLGHTALQEYDPVLAVDYLNKCLLLDPDFKAGYVNLAVGLLRCKCWLAALQVAEASLQRHPDSPQQYYHIGVATYQLALHATDEEESASLRSRSYAGFAKARSSEEARRRLRGKQESGQLEVPWLKIDDLMMKAMDPTRGGEEGEDSEGLPPPPVELPSDIGWSVYNPRM